MELSRVLAVVEFYDTTLREEYNVAPVQRFPGAPQYARTFGKDTLPAPELFHCRYMISEMRQMIADRRTEKVMRWYGFLQGVLWVQGIFTLDELKDHSRPDYPPPVFTVKVAR